MIAESLKYRFVFTSDFNLIHQTVLFHNKTPLSIKMINYVLLSSAIRWPNVNEFSLRH